MPDTQTLLKTLALLQRESRFLQDENRQLRMRLGMPEHCQAHLTGKQGESEGQSGVCGHGVSCKRRGPADSTPGCHF